MIDGATRRLFVGVFPPAAAVAHLGRAVDALELSQSENAAAALTARDGWHLTLAFLGPVPVDHLAAAAAAIDRAAADCAGVGHAADRAAADRAAADCAGVGHAAEVDDAQWRADHAGVVVRLAGAGTFGGGHRQILWVGVNGDVTGLRQLAETVRRELAAVGLATDGRDFRAHLTITRPGVPLSPEQIDADLARLSHYEGPQWTVAELCLVASEPAQTAAGRRSRYTTLHRGRLSESW